MPSTETPVQGAGAVALRAAVLVLRFVQAFGWCVLSLTRRKLTGGRESKERILGEALRRFFVSLGGAYAKIGQLLAMRPDLLGKDLVKSLADLHESLPSISFQSARTVIETDLKAPVEKLFANFSQTAFASATIASVFRAELWSGEQVAVKVKRPGIGDAIESDLAILRTMGIAFSRIGPFRSVPVAETIAQIGRALQQQLDFGKEVKSNERFRDNLKMVQGLTLPKVFANLSGPNVITMELMENVRRIDEEDAISVPHQRALHLALRVLYRMIFFDGFIHCDMHDGNVFFRDNGTVVLIDTGFTAELSYLDRIRFANFFHGLVMGLPNDCLRIIIESAISLPQPFDPGPLSLEITKLIGRVHKRVAREFEVSGFVLELFEIMRRHKVFASSSFTMPIVALLFFEGILRRLAPDLDFQREARPFLAHCLVLQMLRECPPPWTICDADEASRTGGVGQLVEK